MKNFNELRNEINEVEKKLKALYYEKKEKAAAKAAAEQEEADKAAHLADQEQIGPKSGSYRIP